MVDTMSTPAAPNLFQLRRLARKQGYLIVKSPEADSGAEEQALYVLVIPDFAGKGTDPSGASAAEAAFAHGAGMTLEEISAELTRGG